MSASKICVILAILAVCYKPASAFQVINCAAGKESDAKLLSLSIDSCPDESAERCNFVKGQNATMTIEFEPTKTFSQANVSIKGVLHHIYIPFKLNGPTDACGHYGFDCPVKVGQKTQMKITVPVLRTYPKIKVAVHFELNDENKKPIVCLEFPVQLVG